MDATDLGLDTRLTLLVAGVVFFWALVLGVVKYVQILRSPEGHAHPYTDIAHRAALMYSFATLLIAVFVELSAFPQGVDLTADVGKLPIKRGMATTPAPKDNERVMRVSGFMASEIEVDEFGHGARCGGDRRPRAEPQRGSRLLRPRRRPGR